MEQVDEPQTDTEIAKAIVHKMIDDAVIAEDAYPDLRQKMHDAVDEYEPQTDGYMTAEQAEDYRKMLDKAEHKVYGNIEGEPQTEDCGACEHSRITCRYMECGEPCRYEPKTDWHYDEQDATWYPYKHEDEPQQKSCATCKHALGNWDGESNNCGRCCGADRRFYEPKVEPQTDGYMTAEQAEDYRKMLDKAEHKVYGNIEDEPQTDCAWR